MNDDISAAYARTLWQSVLNNAATDEQAQTALTWIIESAVIDLIDNRMRTSDEYAVVIGKRITRIIQGMEQG